MATPYELDHVFVCTDVGAPEAEVLVDFGLSEGTANRHPGQGTANRRFFFQNAMIELVFVVDSAEAASGLVRRTGLFERWKGRDSGASPFGICLRPGSYQASGPPFPAWEYKPPYFSSPAYLGTNSELIPEPLIVYLPFARRPAPSEQPLEHRTGFRELTAVRIQGPTMEHPSAELEALARTGLVELAPEEVHRMEIGFDGETQGRSTDFSPVLPLTLRW